MFLLPRPQGRGAAWDVEGQRPPPAPLQMPHRVPGPQPREEALDLCSCSSRRLRLSLDIIAFLPPWGEAAGQPPCQATWSLMAGLQGSPTTLPHPPGGAAEGSCLRAPGQKCRQVPAPPSPFPGACADEKLEPPSRPQAGSWGRWWSLSSPGLGTEMRTGRILKAGLLGPLRGVWQRAEEKTGNGGEGVTDGDANEKGKKFKKKKKGKAPRR